MNTPHNHKDLLLVIDMQNVYLPDQRWACPRMPQVIDNVCRILRAAACSTAQTAASTAPWSNDNADHRMIGEGNASTTPQILFTRFLAPANPVGTWVNYNVANQAVNEDVWLNALTEPFHVDEATSTVAVDLHAADHMAVNPSDNIGEPDDGTYPLYSKSTYSALTIPAIRAAALHCDRLVLTGVVADCCVLWTAMAAIDLGIPVVYIADAVAGIDDESEAAADRVIRGLSPVQTTLMTTQEYLTQIAEG